MSAEGSVEIAVRAEGADDAAEELAQGAESGDGGGRGGLAQSITGGIVGGLLAQGLGPILDLLDPILKILQAFLAPVAVLLMRLLTPVLRELIKLLPAWFAFMNDLPAKVDEAVSWLSDLTARAVKWLRALPGRIWTLLTQGFDLVRDRVSDAVSWLRSLPRRLWTFMRRLPSLIGQRIAANVPGVSESQGSDLTRSAGEAAFRGVGSAFGPPGQAAVNIALSGGLGAFVDRIERETGFELP